MNRLEDLQKLIGNMSKSEKGYFKKFVRGFSSATDNNYLQLFDLLDRPVPLTSKEIEQHFSQKSKKVNQGALRAYLYQMLLKSLRLYNEKDNYRFEATNRINEVEVLMDKGLDEQAYVLSLEGVEHCRKYGLHELELVFLKYAHHVFGDTVAPEDIPAEREKYRAEIMATTKQVEYFTEIRHLEFAIINLANMFFPTADEKKLEELEELVKHEVLRDFSKLTTLEAILGFHNVWRVYFSLKGETQKGYDHVARIAELIEQHMSVNKNFIGRYVRGVFNQSKLASDLQNPELAWGLLVKLKNIPVESPGDAMWLELIYTTGIIYFLKNNPQYRPDAMELAKQAESILVPTFDTDEGYKMSQVYDLAVFHFRVNNYNHALDLLAMILNRKPVGSQNMNIHTRLLQIVIHYELGNRLLLPSLMKSTFRYMARCEIKFEFERVILRFFTRVLRPSNHVVLKDELEWMKNEMQNMLSEYEKTPLKKFDYIEWLTLKAGGATNE